MQEVTTHTEINASAERVWQAIADFPGYAAWNPLFPAMKGQLREGARLRGKMALGKMTMPFFPKVNVVVPGKELCWTGASPIPGTFTGRHRMIVEPIDDSTCTMTHNEVFTGVFASLLGKRLEKIARESYKALDAGLAKHVS